MLPFVITFEKFSRSTHYLLELGRAARRIHLLHDSTDATGVSIVVQNLPHKTDGRGAGKRLSFIWHLYGVAINM